MTAAIPPRPPAAGPPRPFAFPEPTRILAPWGGELAVARVRTIPVVHVRYTTPRGICSLVEEGVPAVQLAARRQLLASTLRHAIGPWDAPGLAAHLDRLGARLSLATSLDQTTVAVSGVAGAVEGLFEVLLRVLTEARATERGLEMERTQALRLLDHRLADPELLAAMWLGHALYGDHPYASPPPDAMALQQVTTDELRAAWAALTPPAGSQLLIVGDIDPDEVIEQALRVFGRLGSPGPAPTRAPAPAAAQQGEVVGVVRPGSEQLTIQLGLRVFPRRNPDYLPLRLAHQVLGAGAGSRLFLRLREAQGLTYDAWSQLDCGALAGDLCCGLSAAPERAREASEGLMRELHGLHASPPTPAELRSAQRQVAGSFPGKASGVGGVARLLSLAWHIGFPPSDWSTYPARVHAMTPDRVARAVQEHVQPAAANVVVVGPGPAVDAALAALPPGTRVHMRERPDRG